MSVPSSAFVGGFYSGGLEAGVSEVGGVGLEAGGVGLEAGGVGLEAGGLLPCVVVTSVF